MIVAFLVRFLVGRGTGWFVCLVATFVHNVGYLLAWLSLSVLVVNMH